MCLSFFICIFVECLCSRSGTCEYAASCHPLPTRGPREQEGSVDVGYRGGISHPRLVCLFGRNAYYKRRVVSQSKLFSCKWLASLSLMSNSNILVTSLSVMLILPSISLLAAWYCWCCWYINELFCSEDCCNEYN